MSHTVPPATAPRQVVPRSARNSWMGVPAYRLARHLGWGDVWPDWFARSHTVKEVGPVPRRQQQQRQRPGEERAAGHGEGEGQGEGVSEVEVKEHGSTYQGTGGVRSDGYN